MLHSEAQYMDVLILTDCMLTVQYITYVNLVRILHSDVAIHPHNNTIHPHPCVVTNVIDIIL